MEEETAGEQKVMHEPCVCREITHQIAAVFGIKSDEARGHLRNARIELLKAMRSVIDDRIEQLSRTGAKGTKVPVE
jgi:DNA-binding FrmR family transcriptional regulator